MKGRLFLVVGLQVEAQSKLWLDPLKDPNQEVTRVSATSTSLATLDSFADSYNLIHFECCLALSSLEIRTPDGQAAS